MKQSAIILYLIMIFSFGGSFLQGENYQYKVTTFYETDHQGQVIAQQPAQGSLTLTGNGSYSLSVHIQDQGMYKYVKANSNQPNDTIYFQSKNNFQFFAYVKGENLAIWISKNQAGRDTWYQAVLASQAQTPQTGPTQPQTGATNIMGLIQKGILTRTVMYGKTSAPSYLWYDREDGGFTADEGGVILRNNGTFYIKSEIGSSLFQDNGRYNINGTQVHLILSDGSAMTFTLVDGGKSLNWYSQGMLLAEYTLLGFVK